MPYILVRYKDGWRVCKRDDPEVCFSKKPLPKKRAKKQMMAIGISEAKGGTSNVVGSAKPKDMELYNRIKKEIYDKNPKHSLYRSAMVVKEYTRQGGEYIDSPDDEKGIPKWFGENWLSANDYLRDKEVPCGANNAEKYGEYPLCYAEERLKKFSKEELRELIDKKTELGKKHLPTKEITGKGETKTEKKLYTLYPSDVRGKKWDIYWINPETDQVNKTSFGAKNMSDYTIHKDEERRERYRNRHKKDNIDEPFSPGALSWYVLWGDSTDIQKNLRDYLRRVKIVK